MRGGLSSLRFPPSGSEFQRDSTQQQRQADEHDNVEMVSFSEPGESESIAGSAYQMVALRRPELTDSGIDSLEVAFLLDCANGLLRGAEVQLHASSALVALEDGVILWCASFYKTILTTFIAMYSHVLFASIE